MSPCFYRQPLCQLPDPRPGEPLRSSPARLHHLRRSAIVAPADIRDLPPIDAHGDPASGRECKGTDPQGRSYIPEKPVLLIEVSNTSLACDRDEKASLYASSGVPEYWIINLVDTQVEVHRDPVADVSQPFGWTWSRVTVMHRGQHLQPLARPEVSILVDRLFEPEA